MKRLKVPATKKAPGSFMFRPTVRAFVSGTEYIAALERGAVDFLTAIPAF